MANRVNTHKCIFCFNILKNTDICFETVDNTVELSPDPKKYAYYRRFDTEIQETDSRCMSRMPIQYYQEGSPEFDLDRETGIPIAWRQPGVFEMTSSRRLCGYCHQRLPHSFGRMPNVTVGLCGNSNAGKTVYMTSLIHDLGHIKNLSLSPDPVFFSGMMDVDWEELYEAMYKGKIKMDMAEERDGDGYYLPTATDPRFQLTPLVLNCTYTYKSGLTKEFSLTLFDMAGEGLTSDAYMARNAIYLQNVAGIIFLKDPDYFPGMERADDALHEHQHLQVMVDAFERKSNGDDRARLAITMTKFDKLLEKHGDNPEFVRMIGNMFTGDPLTQHPDGFNMALALSSNRRLYELYGWENTRDQVIRGLYTKMHDRKSEEPKKRGILELIFGPRKPKKEPEPDKIKQWVMLFAASPLGRDVQIIDSEEEANPAPAPIYPGYAMPGASVGATRVKVAMQPHGMLNVDPILWLLYCYDIFPAKRGDD